MVAYTCFYLFKIISFLQIIALSSTLKSIFLVLNEISSIKCVCIKLSSANKVVIIFVEKKTTFTEKSY